ncbi:MAG TPA: hypothetical protein VEU96_11030 [Bryobacteraceae bacterium]|nr:hypothetical protein [Bryobacteraceae bacterium]
MRSLFLLVCLACDAATLEKPDPHRIVQRSVEAIETDWSQAPNYAFQERDVQSKRDGAPVIKTYEVLMIDGSQYNRLIAVDDKPLLPGDQMEEERKLRAEMNKRARESPRESAKRIAKYQKERDQDHAMLKNMVEAFDFQLAGEEIVNGYDCWVLDATPKRGYQPKDRETKVLTGMRGRLWVDKSQNQWVKVKAEVIKPVSLFGFFAKVGPGTRFQLEQAPVADNLWLPSHFSMRVNASAFGFINEDSSDDETYGKYVATGKATAVVPGERGEFKNSGIHELKNAGGASRARKPLAAFCR